MQGSLILPRRFSQQSAAVVQSAIAFSPEVVGALRCYPSRTYQSCELVQVVDRQSFRSRRADSSQVLHSPKKSCASCRQGACESLTVEDKKSARMRGSSLGSFPSCSYSRSVTPLMSHATVANGGQNLDSGSWKRLSSTVSVPFHCNQAKPWLSVPFRAFPALKTTHYGSLACMETRQDVLTQKSEKGLVSALGRAELAGNTQGEKATDREFTAAFEDSDSDSDEEDDENDIKKKQKKEMKPKGMQEEEDSDSDSESDCEEMEQKKMKKKSKGMVVEVVGTCEDDSDSESESDEEKEMKKMIKAQEKELKKQAKKQKKAMSKIDGEYSESGGEEKKMKKEKKEQKAAIATLPDADLDQQYQYIEASESDGASEDDVQEDDGVEIVASALQEDEYEEDDFELVGDEELSEELESDIENALEEYDDEELDDDFWEEDEDGEAMVGDGGDGGGVALGETRWGKKALELAEVVVKEMGTDFTIYAFKTSPDGQIRVRLDKMSDQYGSPTMKEIEDFIVKYRAILDSCEAIPDNISVEVSSPGAERMVKIPDELERFKQLPMYVQYYEDESRKVEKDGVLELDSFDSGSGMTVWKLANVKLNRELSGKGRPLNSKQRKWRAQVPADSLTLVRLYLDV